MTIDVPAARSFLATHGRLLDRRRFDHLLGSGDALGVLAALDAHRNADGGYGWGLEPDLRSWESQPTAAMHAFEILAEVAPTTSARSVELCDWLGVHTLPDGGLPLALPVGEPAGSAPWWVGADPSTSTIQMTAQVAANAHLVARHDPAVRDHPWLARATAWCLAAIGDLRQAPAAHELLFALRFVDAAADHVPAALDALEQLRAFVPSDGVVAVAGGSDGEVIRPLDLVPRPDGPARSLLADEVVTAELRRLAEGQQADGGWTVDFTSASPMGALEWRGYTTVNALKVLAAHRWSGT